MKINDKLKLRPKMLNNKILLFISLEWSFRTCCFLMTHKRSWSNSTIDVNNEPNSLSYMLIQKNLLSGDQRDHQSSDDLFYKED